MRVAAFHRLCLAVLLATPLAAGPALAQSTDKLPMRPPPLTAPKATKQPAALPGATSSGPAAERRAGSLLPNDALFDAINRGDTAAAREAVNRGADIDARNVLGLTPIELSVDLGRNDITFLLLSMRGGGRSGGGGGTAPPPAQAARDAAPVLPMQTAPRIPVTRVAADAPRPAPAPAPVQAPRPVASKSAAQPTLGHDPGTPDPAVGFLGFGGNRSP
jgi:hypothetical protein